MLRGVCHDIAGMDLDIRPTVVLSSPHAGEFEKGPLGLTVLTRNVSESDLTTPKLNFRVRFRASCLETVTRMHSQTVWWPPPSCPLRVSLFKSWRGAEDVLSIPPPLASVRYHAIRRRRSTTR